LNLAIKQSNINESMLIWAVVGSILLHIMLFVVIPNFKFDAIKIAPDVLKVELVQPKKLDPVIVPDLPKPAPPKPEVAKPIEKIKPLPEPIKPPPKTTPKTELIPAQENRPEVAQTAPPPPAVIAVTPKPDAPPVAVTVPAPEPVKEKPVNDDAYNSAKGSYKSSVQKEIQRNLRYPKMAEKRRITGVAKVEIHLDKEGNVTSVNVISSSGNDSLDTEAIAVIKRSDLKQFMNDTLADRINPLIMPISFTLPEE
jgi:periplasmic protein TonB